MSDVVHNDEQFAAVARLAATFSRCPDNPHDTCHTWNYDTGKCEHCKRPFPYGGEN